MTSLTPATLRSRFEGSGGDRCDPVERFESDPQQVRLVQTKGDQYDPDQRAEGTTGRLIERDHLGDGVAEEHNTRLRDSVGRLASGRVVEMLGG